MQAWLAKLGEWLFRRGGNYRADFEAVVDRWQELYHAQELRIVAIQAALDVCVRLRVEQEVKIIRLEGRVSELETQSGASPRTQERNSQ